MEYITGAVLQIMGVEAPPQTFQSKLQNMLLSGGISGAAIVMSIVGFFIALKIFGLVYRPAAEVRPRDE